MVSCATATPTANKLTNSEGSNNLMEAKKRNIDEKKKSTEVGKRQ